MLEPKYKWLRIKQYNEDGTESYVVENDKYASLIECLPDGWAKAFGEKMVDELNEIIEKYDFADSYNIQQIKEKYGMLRWYDSGVPIEATDEYYAWLNKYAVLSEQTCIKCGNKATHMTKGWIVPLCDECDKK